MKTAISKYLLFLAPLVCSLMPLRAGEAAWLTDYEKATAQAGREKKLVLVNFTGSDFCVGCKALHKAVFSTKEFASYAAGHLVLVELDFPESKPQSESLRRTNQELMEHFKVDGFPTVIVVDSSGKELKRMLGYSGADAATYIKDLKKLEK